MNTPIPPPPPFPPPPPPPPGPLHAPTGPPPTLPDRTRRSTEPTFAENLFANAEAILKWTGVVLVVLSAVFGVSKAIDAGLIGPELQLAGAALISIALIALGLRIDSERPEWSHALAHAGLAGLFATTTATSTLVDSVPAGSTLGALVAVYLASLAIAVLLQRQAIAMVSTLWLTIASLVAQPWDHFPAGSIAMAIGALALVGLLVATHQRWASLHLSILAVSGWAILALSSFAIGWFEAEGLSDASSTNRIAIGATAFFIALLAWVPQLASMSIGAIERRHVEPLISRARIAVPFWLWGVVSIVTLIDEPSHRFGLALGISCLLALAALPFILRSAGGIFLEDTVVGISVMVPASLLPLGASATTVGIALILVVLSATWRSTRSHLIAIVASILASGLAGVTLFQLNFAWEMDAPLSVDFANLAAIIAVGLVAWVLRGTEVSRAAAWTALAGLIVWIPTVLVHFELGVALISVAWAAIAFVLVAYGVQRSEEAVALAGFALLGIVLVKLFYIDLAHVDTLIRAATFCLIGAGLLALGYSLPGWMKRTQESTTVESSKQ